MNKKKLVGILVGLVALITGAGTTSHFLGAPENIDISADNLCYMQIKIPEGQFLKLSSKQFTNELAKFINLRNVDEIGDVDYDCEMKKVIIKTDKGEQIGNRPTNKCTNLKASEYFEKRNGVVDNLLNTDESFDISKYIKQTDDFMPVLNYEVLKRCNAPKDNRILLQGIYN
jgi:hypothetical protein